MYEKVKVEYSGVPEGACNFCERPKSIVICNSCRNVVANVRHRRRCTEHPREFFLMDIVMCRYCKGQNLLEVGLDEIPDDMIAVISPPESPVRPTASGSGAPSPATPRESPARPSSSGSGSLYPSPPLSNSGRVPIASTGLSPIKENSNPAESMDVVEQPNMMSPAPLQQRNSANLVPGRGRGLKRQRISLTQIQATANTGNAQGSMAVATASVVNVPVASPCSPQAPSPVPAPAPVPVSVVDGGGGKCICMRVVHFLVCSNCGYYAQSVRKYIPCSTHPNEKQGIKFCPECGSVGDNLDETCFEA